MVLVGREILGSEDFFFSSRLASRVRPVLSSEASAGLLEEMEFLPARELFAVSPCNGLDLEVSAQPRAKLTMAVPTWVQTSWCFRGFW